MINRNRLLLITASIVAFATILVYGGWIIFYSKYLISNIKSPTTNIPTSTIIYQNTYSSALQFMQGIYDADHHLAVPASGPRIRGLIVPHHLTASESIASGIKMLTNQTFKKILLITPDHFNSCPTLLCTTPGTYQTFFGNVSPDPAAEKILSASPLVTVDSEMFKQEHGIFAVEPFIVHYFPDISVTPLAISQNKLSWTTDESALLQLIEHMVDSDTIVIVSSDFSHYLPLETANQMDKATIKTLLAKNLNGLASLKNPDQSDCPSCLWTLAALANARSFYHPTIVLHTNSAIILNDKNIPQTTSHFSMVWYEDASLNSR